MSTQPPIPPERTAHKNSSEATKDLEDRVRSYAQEQPWVQDIELPGGLRTRPDIPIKDGSMVGKWRRLEPLLEEMDLHGKRVLDVGCNEGFFSIEAASRGARVLGVDLDPMRIEKARFVAEVLGVQNVDFEVMDIYNEDFSRLGRYDVAFMIGMVHRLPDPFRALQRVSALCDMVIIEWKTFHWGPYRQPVAYYVPGVYVEEEILHPKYWWVSPTCLKGILKDLGFNHLRLLDDERSNRAMLVAGKLDHKILQAKPDDVVPLPLTKRLRHATRDCLGVVRQAFLTSK